MMSMLQLFNKGRNPFPHLKGKGGLLYHPYRHMIGGQSIIKPKERVPYFDAHIIGGMIGGEEYQLESYLSPEDLQTYKRLNERFAPKQTHEDEDEEEHEEPIKKLEPTIQPSHQLYLFTRNELLDESLKITIPTIKEQLDHYKISYTTKEKKDVLLKKLKDYLESKQPKKVSEKKVVLTPKEYIERKFLDDIEKAKETYAEQIKNCDKYQEEINKLRQKIEEQTNLKKIKELENIKSEYENEIFRSYATCDVYYKRKFIEPEDFLKILGKKYPKLTREESDELYIKVHERYIEYVTEISKPLLDLYIKHKDILSKEKDIENSIKDIHDRMISYQTEKPEDLESELEEKKEIESKEIYKAERKEGKKLSKEETKKLKNESSKLRDEYIKLFPDDINTQAELGDEIIPEKLRKNIETKIADEKLRLEQIQEKKQSGKPKVEKEIEPINQGYVNDVLNRYNMVDKGSSLIKEIENAYNFKKITNSTYTAILAGMKLKYPELEAIYEAKKANKKLTKTEMDKILKSLKTSHGKAFETVMIGLEGKKFIKTLTGSDSNIIPTDQSKNIDHIIVGSDSSGIPITLAESCVIDAYNDKACFEFKARISSKGAIDYSKVDYIGLTDTKLSNNISFRLVFDKTSNGKFKIKNVIITDPRNKSKKLFTDDVSKDYYAIFLFSDLKVYYYDILDDMTDDVNDYGDNGKKKGILVEELLDGTYQFDQCNYELKTTSIGKEYQIPKNKIHKII